MRHSIQLAAACLGLTLSAPPFAAANDSTAVLAAGGLRLEKSTDIAVLSETLRISPRRIVVDYAMQNTSRSAVDTIIAFPLPLLEGPQLANVPVDVPKTNSENFVGFETKIDGTPVTTAQQIKAFLLQEDGRTGRDVTAELTAAGMLMSPLDRSFFDRLAELPRETQETLRRAKLLDVFEHGTERTFTPLWAVEYSYYSKLRFEPGKTVRVHHEYTPVVGRSLFGDFSGADDLSPWCVDASTRAAVRKMIDRRPVTAGWTKLVERKQVDYILRTGANWAGPIRKFELVLEKENPAQVVSLCAEGLTKVGDREFHLTRTNYTPKEDLTVLFFDPSLRSK